MTYPKKAFDLLRLLAVVTSLSPFTTPLPAQQSTAVPPAIQVPAGNEEYLRTVATGTQNYMCMASGWTFVGPQATLFVKLGALRQQVATHFLSPNPAEAGVARATWQSSFDTSSVWASAVASSTDYAEAGAIPWLLLHVAGSAKGPNGGSAVSETTYIQRVNTSGGVAPTTACVVGTRVFVPYTAEYVFYRQAAR